MVLGKPFHRPPVQADFVRLKYYAQRIKNITYASTSLIAPHILGALAIHFPPGTLLPNLRTLGCRWFASNPSEIHQLFQVFVGPNLCILHLTSSLRPDRASDQWQPREDDLDYLRTLPRLCPTLSEISISINSFKSCAPHIGVMSDIIHGFQDLTSFLVPGIPLDFETILRLGNLRNLNTLDVYPPDSINQDDYQSLVSTLTGAQAYFPSLRMLYLQNCFLFSCTFVLGLVSSPVLHDFSLKVSAGFGIDCDPEDVAKLCAELGRHPSLTSIVIGIDCMSDGRCLDRATFEPLLRLSNLRTMMLDFDHGVRIDNAFLADMARAWPKLCELGFCTDQPHWHPRVHNPAATLLGLVLFALCPNLRVLGIPLNADMSRIPPKRLERSLFGSAPRSPVYHLDVGLSVVRDPVPVAGFLSNLFPSLFEVFTAWRDHMEDELSDLEDDIGSLEEIKAGWSEVEEMVAVFGWVRMQEQRWAADHRRSRLGAGADADASP